MRHAVFAMDTYFYHSSGSYPYEVRCEMLRELGYDMTYLTLWNDQAWEDLDKVADTKTDYGLDVAAVYASPDIAADVDATSQRRITEVFRRLPPGSCVEVNLSCSDSSIPNSSAKGDDRAARLLEPMLEEAEANDGYVCIYPHLDSWAERVEDGIRLCGRLPHPRLKVVFCGFHWKAADGKDLPERIAHAAPYLHSVNICGCGKEGWPIQCVGEGEMDNFALLGLLEKNGYTGKIGFQGYSIGGDVYANLRRSLEAYREMEERLERHPDWAALDFTHTI